MLGSDRPSLPLLARPDGTASPDGGAWGRRGPALGLRLLGIGALFLGVVAAAAGVILVPGAAGIAVAVLAGASGAGFGAMALRAGVRHQQRAELDAARTEELAILRLAEQSHGDLTATEVARRLGIGSREADDRLMRLADGSRVTVELDDDGIVHYVFRELGAIPGDGTAAEVPAAPLDVKMRVADDLPGRDAAPAKANSAARAPVESDGDAANGDGGAEEVVENAADPAARSRSRGS